MGKRIVSLLLAFVLVLSYVPQVRAEGTEVTPVKIEATVTEALIQGQDSVIQKVDVNGVSQDVEVYDFWRLNPQITVHYSDNTTQEYTYSSITGATGIFPDMGVDWGNAAEGGIWTVGGKNNLLTVMWNGLSCQTKVTVEENPVESVSMSIDHPYYVGVDTSHLSKWDTVSDREIEWTGYDPMHFGEETHLTINYKNASSETLLAREVYERFNAAPTFSIGMEQETWTPGQYAVTGRFLGCDFTVTMNLLVNPVQSFIVTTNGTFAEGQKSELWDPETGNTYMGYDPAQLIDQISIVLPHGGTAIYTLDNLSDNFPYPMDFVTDQTTNPWGVGTHDVTAKFMGKEFKFQVEVVADPIKSVSIESPIVMTQGLDTTSIACETPDGDVVVDGIYEISKKNPKITVTYTDGTAITVPMGEIEQHFGAYVSYTNDLAETAQWKPGNTYDWEMELLGHKFTAKVQVLANPVAKIEVGNVTMKYSQGENVQYGWDEETQQQLFFRLYSPSAADFPVTITYADGTKEALTYYQLADKDENTHINFDQSPTSPWEVGKTYTATLVSSGYEVDFKVTISDDRVKTLTVTPNKPLYEGISNWDSYLYATNPSIKATLADGTTLIGDWSLISEQLWIRDVEHHIEGGDENGILSVGKHNAYLIIDGVKATFTVEVLANTIKHIEVILPYDLVENVHGHTMLTLNQDEEEVEYFYYDLQAMECAYKVTYQDGSVKSFGNRHALHDVYGEDPWPFILQSYESQLKLGENKVKINVYGTEYENTVTVVKNPIKSISAVYTKDLIAGVDSELRPIWDPETGEYIGEREDYYLDWSYVRFTVTYENGSQEQLSADSYLFGSPLFVLCDYGTIESDQETNAWTAGKHKWTITALGHTFDVPVTVVKNDIVKVSAKATKNLVDGWHQSVRWNGDVEYYDFWYAMPEVTLTFTDGSTKTYSFAQLQKAYPSAWLIDDVAANGPGKKTAKLEVNGVVCSFEVEVKENPIKSITAVPTTALKEGYLGTVTLYYPGYGNCTFQNYVPADTTPIYTITYKDGTTQVVHGDHQVFENFVLYPSYHETHGPNDPYAVGKHTIQIELLGHTFDYTFEIVKEDNPLEKITAKPIGQLLENVYPYSYQTYYYGNLIEVTLHYKDGSTKTGIADSILPSTSRLMIEFSDSQDTGEKWGVGKHKVKVLYKNLEAETEIEVIPNPYKGVEIANGKDGLTVTLTTEAGTKEVMNAKRFKLYNWDGSSMYYGTLVTDKASFFASFCMMDGKILYMDYQGLRSNGLDTDQWLHKQMETEIVGDLPDILLSYGEGDLADVVLTDSDRVSGYSRAWLIAEDLTGALSAEDQALLDAAKKELPNYTNGLLLDLSMYKEGMGVRTMKVATLDKAITITIPLEGLDGTNKVFKMLRIHNGETEILDCVYDAATNSISFLTDRFSTYSMVYTDALPAVTPATGDATPVALLTGLVLVSAAALVVLWLTERKKRAV